MLHEIVHLRMRFRLFICKRVVIFGWFLHRCLPPLWPFIHHLSLPEVILHVYSSLRDGKGLKSVDFHISCIELLLDSLEMISHERVIVFLLDWRSQRWQGKRRCQLLHVLAWLIHYLTKLRVGSIGVNNLKFGLVMRRCIISFANDWEITL